LLKLRRFKVAANAHRAELRSLRGDRLQQHASPKREKPKGAHLPPLQRSERPAPLRVPAQRRGNSRKKKRNRN